MPSIKGFFYRSNGVKAEFIFIVQFDIFLAVFNPVYLLKIDNSSIISSFSASGSSMILGIFFILG